MRGSAQPWHAASASLEIQELQLPEIWSTIMIQRSEGLLHRRWVPLAQVLLLMCLSWFHGWELRRWHPYVQQQHQHSAPLAKLLEQLLLLSWRNGCSLMETAKCVRLQLQPS